MPISGLVVTLCPDREQFPSLVETLSRLPGVMPGEPFGDQVPLVAETETEAEHEALWERLAAIDGVLRVRLAYYDFSDITEFGAAPGHRGRPRQSGPRVSPGG